MSQKTASQTPTTRDGGKFLGRSALLGGRGTASQTRAKSMRTLKRSGRRWTPLRTTWRRRPRPHKPPGATHAPKPEAPGMGRRVPAPRPRATTVSWGDSAQWQPLFTRRMNLGIPTCMPGIPPQRSLPYSQSDATPCLPLRGTRKGVSWRLPALMISRSSP